jgi:RNA polymerase sigma factor (sigma-70 family)
VISFCRDLFHFSLQNISLGGHHRVEALRDPTLRNELREVLKQFTRPIDPDAVLLQRFVHSQDSAAFAELVQRHGGLVWSQCRQMLGASADAEDAFQATFVVLMQSAKKLSVKDQLGPWLHGVAHRVCLNARRTRARRLQREQRAAKSEAVESPKDSWDETLTAVHEEVDRLPETLRVPFVMCYLEGQPTTQAAEQLGLKLGTFSARLSRAKDKIVDRLTKRGCLTAVAWSAMAAGASAAPPHLTNQLIQGVTNVVFPAQVFALTQGVVGVTIAKYKFLAASVLVAGTILSGTVGLWTVQAQGPAAGAGDPPASVAPKKPRGEEGGPGPAGRGLGGPGGMAGPAGGAAGMAGPGIMPPGGGPGMGSMGGMGMPVTAHWEYKVVKQVSNRERDEEQQLTKLGQEGWELVAVTTSKNNTTSLEQQTYYLKRRAVQPGMGGGFPGGGGFGGFGGGGMTTPGGGGRMPGAGGEAGGRGGAGSGMPGATGEAGGGPGSGALPRTTSPVGNPLLVGGKEFMIVNGTVEEVGKDVILCKEGFVFRVDSSTLIRKANGTVITIGAINKADKIKVHRGFDQSKPVMIVTVE